MPDLQFILDRIKERFPRTDCDLERHLSEDIIGTHIPDVCRHYPWWFLDGGAAGGGGTFQQSFPVTEASLTAHTFPFENWLDRGWLLIDEGVDSYVMGDTAKPGEGDLDSTTWDAVLINHLKTVRIFDFAGNCIRTLEVMRPDNYRDAAIYSTESQGEPCRATLMEEYVGGRRVSILKVNPLPDGQYVAQLDFQLQVPPTISTGTGAFEVSNIVIDTYPELVIAMGMLMAAEYFNEQRLMAYYEAKVWGSPAKGSVSRNAQKGGLVGRMKRDSRIRKSQREKAISFQLGNPFSAGNKQGGRNRNRGYYGRYSY